MERGGSAGDLQRSLKSLTYVYTTGLNAPWFFIVLIGQKLMESNNKLKRGLSTRHIRFMALGSAIGTGLFYGSADAIKMAGPSVLLAYIIGGVAAYIIMRALGEMSVHNPAASSFSRYAQENLGPLAGYITGWTYCFEILIVAIADVTAFGIYMGVWFPAVPHWIWVLSVVLIICAINLMSVKVFGELEFWFSFFKVATIIIMIVAGIGIIVWGIGNGGQPTGIHNLWSNGGFFSNGWLGMIMSLQMVMFAYGGIEIIGITAGEAKDPEKSIPRAINSVPMRILVFYVGTLFVIMSIYPWKSGRHKRQSICADVPAYGDYLCRQHSELCGIDRLAFRYQLRCVWRRPYAAWYGGAGERAESLC